MKTNIKEQIYFAYNREMEYFAVIGGIFAENLDGRLCREIYGEDFILRIRKKHRELYEVLNTMLLGGLELLEFIMNYDPATLDIDGYRAYVEQLPQADFAYQLFGYRATMQEVEAALCDDEKLSELLDQGKCQVKSFVTLKRILNHRKEFLDLYFACLDDIRTPELEAYLDSYEKMIPMLQKDMEQSLNEHDLLEVTSRIVGKCLPIDWVYENNLFMPVCMLPRNAVTYYEKNQIVLYSMNRMVSRKKALDILKVVSDETRIQIVDLLSESGTANGKKIAKWARLAPSTVSHHMEQLVECGIVKEVKIGTSKEYSIDYENGENFLMELEGIILKNKEHKHSLL
ncbi:MAG: metalloregulator ArsR/SmtB family transcription factor [bacterium]|nr:metalloregulator ArsR/SmtB family transcription factor [bacterium]